MILHKKIDKEMILEVSIGQLFIIKVRKIKILYWPVRQYQKELNKNNLGIIETEIKMIDDYFYAEQYHQQYLASEGSRQYCSASPTKVNLGDFTGSNYKLKRTYGKNLIGKLISVY